MTDREKIIEIIESNKLCILDMGCNDCPYKDKLNKTYSCGSYKLADTLIEAGIGDVTEYKHRAEVAERALLTACVNLLKDEEGNVNMELLVRVVYTHYLRNAEKELAEE